MRGAPISAIVVNFNEAELLDSCLQSINFCDEIIVVDLGSSDNSVPIAKARATKVLRYERVPIVEIVRHWAVPQTKHDWVLITDPDEVIHKDLSEEIIRVLPTIADDVAVVWVPIQFYFNRYPLKGTVWGGNNKRLLLLNKKRVTLHPKVHVAGIEINAGRKALALSKRNNNVIHHYWMRSYASLLSKHRRYVRNEGKVKYDKGERASVRDFVSVWQKSFYTCFIRQHGYRDGLTGLFLSIFWAWYNWASLISLWRYQSKLDKKRRFD